MLIGFQIKKKIFFDMDGVLADFDRGVREFCGRDPCSRGDDWQPGDDDEMWARIRKADHYYDRLELMPDAKEMFDYGEVDPDRLDGYIYIAAVFKYDLTWESMEGISVLNGEKWIVLK